MIVFVVLDTCDDGLVPILKSSSLSGFHSLAHYKWYQSFGSAVGLFLGRFVELLVQGGL